MQRQGFTGLLGSLSIVLLLGGCLTAGSPTDGGVVPVEKLRAGNKSIVIVHTSLHDRPYLSRCAVITAVLAHRDGSGQYVAGQTVTLKGHLDLKQVPSRVELAAGEYGIVRVTCINPRGDSSNYTARVAKPGNIIDGSGAIYDQPFAQFAVAPGEVVDIGSLRLASRPGPPPTTLAESLRPGAPPSAFIGVVTPIPEVWLSNLAQEEPGLFAARVVRPMTVANDCQLDGNRVRCPVRRPKNG